MHKPTDRPPEGCYCEPGKCMAPVIMGRQMPCRDPEKARGKQRCCDNGNFGEEHKCQKSGPAEPAAVSASPEHPEDCFCVKCNPEYPAAQPVAADLSKGVMPTGTEQARRSICTNDANADNRASVAAASLKTSGLADLPKVEELLKAADDVLAEQSLLNGKFTSKQDALFFALMPWRDKNGILRPYLQVSQPPNLAEFLALKVWDNWHGPLCTAPANHFDTKKEIQKWLHSAPDISGKIPISMAQGEVCRGFASQRGRGEIMSLAEKWEEYRAKFEIEYSDSEIRELQQAFYAGAQAAMQNLPNDVPLSIVGQSRVRNMMAEILDRFRSHK